MNCGESDNMLVAYSNKLKKPLPASKREVICVDTSKVLILSTFHPVCFRALTIILNSSCNHARMFKVDNPSIDGLNLDD